MESIAWVMFWAVVACGIFGLGIWVGREMKWSFDVANVDPDWRTDWKAGVFLWEYIHEHLDWSLKTFGGPKPTDTVKLTRHIGKELMEVVAKPEDAEEWADIVILAIDGAMRNGSTPFEFANVLIEKQRKNKARTWNIPDDPTLPNEHVRAA